METDPSGNSSDSAYRTLFLSGEFDSILDDKNRILVPADFRREFAEARAEKTLICRVGRNKVALLYALNYYQEMIARRRPTLLTGEDEDRFNQAYYGMTFKLALDAQGRIVIPEKIMRRANMGKNLTLVGAGDHVEIWNRDEWERRSQTLQETIDEIAARERDKPIL
jgi:MraZ protein